MGKLDYNSIDSISKCVNRVRALGRFGLSGEAWRLTATLLTPEIDPVRAAGGPWGKDRKKLPAILAELVGFLDGLDDFVFNRHPS
jgi:hypothetical protein